VSYQYIETLSDEAVKQRYQSVDFCFPICRNYRSIKQMRRQLTSKYEQQTEVSSELKTKLEIFERSLPFVHFSWQRVRQPIERTLFR